MWKLIKVAVFLIKQVNYNSKMKYMVLLLLIMTTNVVAQKKDPQYYIFDKDWKPAKDVVSADYIIQTTSIGDSLFVNRIFKGRRYLWRQESFKDAEQTVAHGSFAWYDDKGRIDSSGQVNNTKKTGSWAYYDDTLGVYLLVTYDSGKETERRDYVNKIIKTPGGVKTFDDEKKERDSAKASVAESKVEEKEAAFKGGAAGYKKYLLKNLVPPTDVVTTGTVK